MKTSSKHYLASTKSVLTVAKISLSVSLNTIFFNSNYVHHWFLKIIFIYNDCNSPKNSKKGTMHYEFVKFIIVKCIVIVSKFRVEIRTPKKNILENIHVKYIMLFLIFIYQYFTSCRIEFNMYITKYIQKNESIKL